MTRFGIFKAGHPKSSGALLTRLLVLAPVGTLGVLGGQVSYGAETKKSVEVSIAAEKKSVTLKVVAPLDVILPHNQRPTKEAEQAALQKALAALKLDSLVFTFPAAAECSIHFSKLETDFSERTLKPADAKQAELQAEGTGGKVIVQYEGSCEKPAQFLSFETSLFTVLQGAQQIYLRGSRDSKKISQNVEVQKARGPVTLSLEGKATVHKKPK